MKHESGNFQFSDELWDMPFGSLNGPINDALNPFLDSAFSDQSDAMDPIELYMAPDPASGRINFYIEMFCGHGPSFGGDTLEGLVDYAIEAGATYSGSPAVVDDKTRDKLRFLASELRRLAGKVDAALEISRAGGDDKTGAFNAD